MVLELLLCVLVVWGFQHGEQASDGSVNHTHNVPLVISRPTLKKRQPHHLHDLSDEFDRLRVQVIYLIE